MSYASKRKKIVVAEDDDAILELITIRLELAGYQTITARNGFQALERIRATMPDGLVLDLGLPGLDGFGVLTELKKMPKKLPVCIVTARGAEEDIQRAVLLGARTYLTKPFNEKIFIERVSRMIRVPAPQNIWGL